MANYEIIGAGQDTARPAPKKGKNSMLKFKNPYDQDINEAKCRFEVIEDRGTDILVRELAVCKDMNIKPTYQYKKEDLVAV